jgi:hypothetical protein
MLRQSLTLLLGLVVALLVGVTSSASAQEASQEKAPQGVCPPPSQGLEGAWKPKRLLVLNPCQTITGTIDVSRVPQYISDDGDVHNQFAPDTQYQNLLTDQQETHGNFVVELMPRDAGHLPVLPVGPKLTLVGALVYDTGHAWTEMHPVYGVCVEGGSCYSSGPQFGGIPRDSAGEREDCRTETGKSCPGYEGQVPTYEKVLGKKTAP